MQQQYCNTEENVITNNNNLKWLEFFTLFKCMSLHSAAIFMR